MVWENLKVGPMTASLIGHWGQALSFYPIWPDRPRGQRFSSQSGSSVSFGAAARMHGIRVWRASLWDALEAQQSYSASSIPSFAWDDPARIGIFGFLSSCRSLRSEPEFCAVNTHAVEQDSNFAGNSHGSSPPPFGFHQTHTPCFQATPCNRSHEHRVGRGVKRHADIGITGV